MKDKILEILTEIRPEFDFSQDVDFIEEGMLDSFDVVSLVDSIEDAFGVSIAGEAVIPENFCSLAKIEETINNSK